MYLIVLVFLLIFALQKSIYNAPYALLLKAREELDFLLAQVRKGYFMLAYQLNHILQASFLEL